MTFKELRRHVMPRGYGLATRRHLRDRLLNILGLERSHQPAALAREPNLSIDSVMRFVVAHQILQQGTLTFMQIGAYDGVVHDDWCDLIARHQLRGVLVEPQPEAFARLQENYRDRSHVTLLNAAIADREGTRDLFRIRGSASTVASFDRAHLLKHGVPPESIVAEPVPCHTIASALRTAGLSHVDLLQVDAEGYDYEIIRTIDFASFRPAILRFEYRHMNSQQMDELIGRMSRFGYQFLVEPRDLIAWRRGEPTVVNAAA